MTNEAKEILENISQYLEKNPAARFSQALSNLQITTFADPVDPSKKGFLLRDLYYDSDSKVLERIQNAIKKNEQI